MSTVPDTVLAATAQATGPAALQTRGRRPPVGRRAGPRSEDPGRDQLRHVGGQTQPPINSPPRQNRNDPAIQAFTMIPPSIHFARCSKSAGDRRPPTSRVAPRVGRVQGAGIVAENRPGLAQRSIEVEDEA
eukprot:6485272-Pyramimonas_sp.AAC.1